MFVAAYSKANLDEKCSWQHIVDFLILYLLLSFKKRRSTSILCVRRILPSDCGSHFHMTLYNDNDNTFIYSWLKE